MNNIGSGTSVPPISVCGTEVPLPQNSKMSDWREYKLSDITSILGDGLHGTPKYDENGDYFFINGNNLSNGKIVIKNDTKRASQSEYEKYKKDLNDRTILVSINGTLGNTALYNGEKCILGKSTCYFNVNSDVDTLFVKYVVTNRDFQEYIRNFATGTTIPNVSLKTMREYSFTLPPLKEQKAIAEVLSSLDDKIDLLHRQNKTLEKLAQTLFRQWFIEEANEGWKEILITDLFEVRDGTHDSPKQKEFGKKLLTSKHILKNKLDFESSYFISEEDFEKINQRSVVEQGDILFSMIGTIGLTYLEQSNDIDYAIKNIGLFKTSQNKIFMYFVYLWINSSFGVEFIHENRSGSTQEYISLGSLRSIVFNLPNYEIIDLFNEKIEPIFQKININTNQTKTLENIRDTLLPKLMSGKVRVEF